MTIITVSGTLYARPETEFWDDNVLQQYGIAEAFCLYLIPDNSENTVDTYASAIRNEFIFWLETPEYLRDEARDYLSCEGIQSHDYLMRDDVARADTRLKCNIGAELDTDEELSPNAAIDALHEAHSYGSDEPEILDPDVWGQWARERIEKTRARNFPPVANWGVNGLTNLPLFVHAINALHAEMKPALDRIDRIKGGCAASTAFKRRLEGMKLHWAL